MTSTTNKNNDTNNIEVPSASPDTNETNEALQKPTVNRKVLKLGLAVLVATALVVGITVPLVNKNKSNDEESSLERSSMSSASAQLPVEPLPAACTKEIMYCQDGTPMERDPTDCRWKAELCPAVLPAACTLEMKYCQDGTPMERDPIDCRWKVELCPAVLPAACTLEMKYCQDGTPMERDSIDCRWKVELCPAVLPPVNPVACTSEIKYCPDNTPMERDPTDCRWLEERCAKSAQSSEKAPQVVCTREFKHCPSGEPMQQDPINCRWMEELCSAAAEQPPEVAEEKDVKADELSHPCNGFSDCEPCLNSRMECSWTGGTCQPNCIIADAACYHPRYFPGMVGPEICAIAASRTAAEQPPEVAEEKDVEADELSHPCNGFSDCEPCLNSRMECSWTGGTCQPNCIIADAACYHPRYFPGMVGPEICAIAASREGVEGPTDGGAFQLPGIAACTMELKPCQDGVTSVGRTGPNCEFELCPEEKPVQLPEISACTLELKWCADGKTSVARTGPNCEFEACPEEKASQLPAP